MTKAMHRPGEPGPFQHSRSPSTMPLSIGGRADERHREDWLGDTFLDAVIRAGFAITGTWPVRTEREGFRSIDIGTNALASSIVLVCARVQLFACHHAPEFVTARQAELRKRSPTCSAATSPGGPGVRPPSAQAWGLYPLRQGARRQRASPLSVREALCGSSTQTVDEVLAEQEGDFDADSRLGRWTCSSKVPGF